MTLVDGSQESIGSQEPAANRCDARRSAEDKMTPSGRGSIAARGLMSPDVAVMFLLLMRQMDRVCGHPRDSAEEHADAGQASAHVY